MKINKTEIAGAYLIDLEPLGDERGYFARTFCKNDFAKAGINFDVAQGNMSHTNKKGTVRGMHFQKEPKSEDKLVSCIKGKLYFVVMDIRKNSPTYKKWQGFGLDGDSKQMVMVPKGCANGFQTLEDDTEVSYLMSEFYSPEHASGLAWSDPMFDVSWPLPISVISEKDKNWPALAE